MKTLVAEFEDTDGILTGAEQARAKGFPVLDALTPFPLEKLSALVGASASPRLRVPMAVIGFGMALAFFALETWTAVFAYPFDEGERPLFSWPAFLLSPFELGILAAAVTGLALFLYRSGLPRLHHPLFAVPGIERASQDRFFLILDPLDGERLPEIRGLLFGAGARAVCEAET